MIHFVMVARRAQQIQSKNSHEDGKPIVFVFFEFSTFL